jgi:hypothetical protein
MADLKRKVDRGNKATSILQDSVVLEAFKELEEHYISQWKSSKIGEGAKRDQAYASLTALEDLKTQLRIFVDGGRMAAKQLERE